MPTFSCDPNLQVSGQLIQSLFCNSEFARIDPFLKKYNLHDVDPQKWYPVSQIAEILNDILHNQGSIFNLVSIGMAATDVTILPPEIKQLPFEQFLPLVGEIYPSNYRGGDPGWIKTEKVGENHFRILLKTPYPDDLFYGQFYRLASIFLPPEVSVTVYYDTDTLRRDHGGEVTILHITWEN